MGLSDSSSRSPRAAMVGPTILRHYDVGQHQVLATLVLLVLSPIWHA